MIKTTAIIFASAASLGASTTAAPKPAEPAHFEITAGPIQVIRENGETKLTIDPTSDTLLKVELSSGKTLNIKL